MTSPLFFKKKEKTSIKFDKIRIRLVISIKGKLYNLGLNLIVATTVQNSVTAATTISLAPTGRKPLEPLEA